MLLEAVIYNNQASGTHNCEHHGNITAVLFFIQTEEQRASNTPLQCCYRQSLTIKIGLTTNRPVAL